MKEITAIIRRDKLHVTKEALADLGLPSLSIQSVEGRGKQRGDVACSLLDMDEDGRTCNSTVVPLLADAVGVRARAHAAQGRPVRAQAAADDHRRGSPMSPRVVDALIVVNQTGQPGDGKIFVSPIEEATRIRTGELGAEAVA